MELVEFFFYYSINSYTAVIFIRLHDSDSSSNDDISVTGVSGEFVVDRWFSALFCQ